MDQLHLAQELEALKMQSAIGPSADISARIIEIQEKLGEKNNHSTAKKSAPSAPTMELSSSANKKAGAPTTPVPAHLLKHRNDERNIGLNYELLKKFKHLRRFNARQRQRKKKTSTPSNEDGDDDDEEELDNDLISSDEDEEDKKLERAIDQISSSSSDEEEETRGRARKRPVIEAEEDDDKRPLRDAFSSDDDDDDDDEGVDTTSNSSQGHSSDDKDYEVKAPTSSTHLIVKSNKDFQSVLERITKYLVMCNINQSFAASVAAKPELQKKIDDDYKALHYLTGKIKTVVTNYIVRSPESGTSQNLFNRSQIELIQKYTELLSGVSRLDIIKMDNMSNGGLQGAISGCKAGKGEFNEIQMLKEKKNDPTTAVCLATFYEGKPWTDFFQHMFQLVNIDAEIKKLVLYQVRIAIRHESYQKLLETTASNARWGERIQYIIDRTTETSLVKKINALLYKLAEYFFGFITHVPWRSMFQEALSPELIQEKVDEKKKNGMTVASPVTAASEKSSDDSDEEEKKESSEEEDDDEKKQEKKKKKKKHHHPDKKKKDKEKKKKHKHHHHSKKKKRDREEEEDDNDRDKKNKKVRFE